MKQSHLQVGVDVPWVTSWTAEAIEGVRPCYSVGGRPALGQATNPGFGRPEYSKNHLLRQRLSVSKMLCPMCGEPTTPDDRVTQVARRVPAGRLRAADRGEAVPVSIANEAVLVDAGAIAPLHRRCSDLSLEHCPHLRAEPEIDVQPFPTRWIVLPLMIEAVQPIHMGGGSMAVVTFLQLLGVTEQVDKAWRTISKPLSQRERA